MAKRISVLLDDDLYKKTRMIQAKTIQRTNESISYSKIINDLLRQSLR
jgi:hypothetical protein